MVAEDTIEKHLLDKIDVIIDGTWKQDIDISEGKSITPTSSDNINFEYELEEIKKRKRKCQMAFANDVITMEDLRLRMQEENSREETIRNQLLVQPVTLNTIAKLTQQEVIEVAKK
ncbi:hypothetical protein [Brevibacillus reuszeri]|uniref:hypothetical protein n=1 Tax=Brevibacillus reuszeri TaxID=54915 RepID=UPI000CCC4454|nr:hypothetical protein [Brevibacillus reuszeri]